MAVEQKRSRWKRRALIAFILLLPLQYVLSEAPAVRLCEAAGYPAWAARPVYFPLWVVSGFSSRLEAFRDAHARVWGVSVPHFYDQDVYWHR